MKKQLILPKWIRRYDVLIVYGLIFIVMLGIPITARKLPPEMSDGEIVITIPPDRETIHQEKPERVPAEKETAKQDEEDMETEKQVKGNGQPVNNEISSKPVKPSQVIKPVEQGEVVLAFGWGMNPIYEDYRYNTGMDIEAPVGTGCRAVFPGSVVKIYEASRLGKVIEIKHDDDLVTVYGHCEKVNVKAGQWVNGGEQIGIIAKSPISQNGYLHFEMYKKGEPVNPNEFLNNN